MAADFSEKMTMMLTRLGLMWCVACGAVVHSSAQDPTKTLPEAYKVQFENDCARVVRVHYDAGASLPEHTHPGGTTVYVVNPLWLSNCQAATLDGSTPASASH